MVDKAPTPCNLPTDPPNPTHPPNHTPTDDHPSYKIDFYIFVYIDTLNIKLHGCRRWPVAEFMLARGRSYARAMGPTSVCLLPQFVRRPVTVASQLAFFKATGCLRIISHVLAKALDEIHLG